MALGLHARLIATGQLSICPEVANDRLRDHTGGRAARDGVGVDGIELLRELIATDPLPYLADALVITAAHTHWGDRVVIERFDKDAAAYWIGPQPPVGELIPISFVFGAEEPIPYEWADASVPMNADDLAEVLSAIGRLNELAIEPDHLSRLCGLGVSLNHRFKRLGSPALFSTMELQHDSGLGLIKIDDHASRTLSEGVGQVAWSARQVPALTPAGAALLSALAEELDGLPPAEAYQRTKELLASLTA